MRLSFLGDCVSILDSEDSPFNDATEMAQFIEGSKPLSWGLIKDSIDLKPNDPECGWGMLMGERVLWVLDSEKDIHYFFKVT